MSIRKLFPRPVREWFVRPLQLEATGSVGVACAPRDFRGPWENIEVVCGQRDIALAVLPAAKKPSTRLTGIRVPFRCGLPRRISGSLTTNYLQSTAMPRC